MNERLPRYEASESHRRRLTRSILVTRHALNTQMKEETGDEVRRENIFHTRCLIQDRTCRIIIDGGSCVNVVSNILVEKLNLFTLKHLRPYNLQWLNEYGEIKLNK